MKSLKEWSKWICTKKEKWEKIKKWTKIQKVYHQRVSTGKWGVMKKHYWTLGNQGKNIYFFLHFKHIFTWKMLKNKCAGVMKKQWKGCELC